MCNLYSITTNQAAIIALFRVLNRYVGNLPPMPGVLSGSRDAQRWQRARTYHDAMGNAAAGPRGRRSRRQHPQHFVTPLANMAEAGSPLLGRGQ
jgi:hypothetical protein